MDQHQYTPPEPLLTIGQVADLLGVSPATVRRLTVQGMPSRVLLRRTRRYYASECVAWVDANCRGGDPVRGRED